MSDPQEPRWLRDAANPGHRRLREALDDAPRHAPSELRARRVWARLSDPGRSNRAVRRAFLLGALATTGLTGVGLLSFAHFHATAPGAPVTAGAMTEVPPVGGPHVPALLPAAPMTIPSSHQPGATAATSGSAESRSAPAVVRLQTGKGQLLDRDLHKGAHAQLQPRSLMVVDETGRPEVRAGRVSFRVAHQPPGQQFEVRVRDFLVVVVGTRFMVGLNDDNVTVNVDEGVVEVWGKERLARLAAGQSWSDRPPRAGATSATPPVTAATTSSHSSPTAGDGDGLGLTEARAARASADPSRALKIYQRLAASGGAAAENALYEIGSIYRDDLERPRQALAAWDRYRSRYPDGLLRAETDLSIVDTLASVGDRTNALREALAFLRRHPRSERRGEVARVAGDLYRAQGNCREAARLYGSVEVTRASVRDEDDAAFGRAACLQALGDSGGPEALRAYLRARPGGRNRADALRLLDRGNRAAAATSPAGQE